MADEKQTLEATSRILHEGRILEPGSEFEVGIRDAERLIRDDHAKAKGALHRLLKPKSPSKSSDTAEE